MLTGVTLIESWLHAWLMETRIRPWPCSCSCLPLSKSFLLIRSCEARPCCVEDEYYYRSCPLIWATWSNVSTHSDSLGARPRNQAQYMKSCKSDAINTVECGGATPSKPGCKLWKDLKSAQCASCDSREMSIRSGLHCHRGQLPKDMQESPTCQLGFQT